MCSWLCLSVWPWLGASGCSVNRGAWEGLSSAQTREGGCFPCWLVSWWHPLIQDSLLVSSHQHRHFSGPGNSHPWSGPRQWPCR